MAYLYKMFRSFHPLTVPTSPSLIADAGFWSGRGHEKIGLERGTHMGGVNHTSMGTQHHRSLQIKTLRANKIHKTPDTLYPRRHKILQERKRVTLPAHPHHFL